MINDITIPDEAMQDAAAEYLRRLAAGASPMAALEAACLAMLRAWPGMEHLAKSTIRISGADVDIPERINLPVGETR